MLDYKYLKIIRLAEDCAILAQMLKKQYEKDITEEDAENA